jgi:hypothetical protein
MKTPAHLLKKSVTLLSSSATYKRIAAFLPVYVLMLSCAYGQKKTNPVITWATPNAIVYGTALSNVQLNATANVAGTFSYSPAAGAVLNAGTQNLTTTFSPTNKSSYNSVSKTVQLVVNKATASVSIAPGSLSQTYNGSPKPVTVTTTPAGVATTVTYNGSTTAPTNVGSYAVVAKITSTNYSGSDAAGTLVINPAAGKIDPVITWANPAAINYGTALGRKQLNASANVAGTFVYNPASGTVPNAGTQILSTTFTPTNTTQYNTVVKTVQIIVNKVNATVTLSNLSQTYNGVAKTVTVTTNPSGLAYSVTYSGSATAPINAGSYAVVATISNPNYNGSASGTLIISKASATLSLSNLSQTFDGSTKSVTVTTNPAGLTGVSVTYAGSATAPTAAGTYAVVASLNNPNYTAANATGSLVITKAAAVITLSNLTQVYDGTQKAASVTTTPSNLTFSITYGGSTTAPTNAGSYAVVATITNPNYIGSANGTLVISKATATLSLNNLSQGFDGLPKSVTVTTSPAGLTGVAVTYNGSATAPTAVGSYVVVASLTNANYTAANATGSLVISSSQAVISLTNLSQVYDGTQKAASATTTPSGLAFSITYDGSVTAPTNAGSYAVVATITNPNYSGSANGTLVISKATATLSLSNLSQGFDGSSKSVTATTNPVGLTGVAVTYDGSATAPTAVGSYGVVASLSNPNYAAANATGSLVISSGQAVITLNNLAQVYDGTPKAASATTTPSNLAYSITYDGSATAPTNAGSYAVVATINDPNYGGSVNGTLVINKASATLSLSDLSQGFDGSPKSVTVATNPAGLSGGVVTYNGSATAPTAAGTYTVVASLNNLNYSAANATGSLVISSNQAVISLTDLEHVYDGTQKGASATTIPSDLSYSVTYDGSPTAPTNAGSYDVIATITDANYNGSTSGTFIINKATATLSLSNLSQGFDGSSKSATVTTSPAGLTGVSVTYNGSATAPTVVGSHAVVASLTNANYIAANATGSLVISSGQAVITLNNLAQVYDGVPKAASATTTPSSLSYTITYNGFATVPTNAGSYAVVATITDPNYSGSATSILVISKATASLTLNATSFAFDGDPKSVSVTTSPAGLSVVSVTYDNNTSAPSAVGTYAVAASLDNPNYQASDVTGTLTIAANQAVVTITNTSQTYDGSAKAVTVATTPEDLATSITYNGSSTVPTNAGSYNVVATVTDPNYAGSSNGTLVIGKATATLTLGTASFTYDGTPQPVSVTTSPAGLSVVSVTYDGSASAPSVVGSYAVAASLSNSNYQASNATGTLTITASQAVVTITNTSQTYDGLAKAVTVTTIPVGLATSITYNGSSTVPTNAGSYPVVASVTDPNYSGFSTNTLVIGKATATLTLGTTNFIYDGTAKPVSVTTNPAGLSVVSVTYNGNATAPTAAGTYSVATSLSNANYQGNTTGTLTIAASPAVITITNTSQTYDGSPKAVTVTTNPSGLSYNITYNGGSTVPTNAGSYAAVATVTDLNYSGVAGSTLVINKATPTLTWTPPVAINYGTALSSAQLNASANVAGSFNYSPTAGTVLASNQQAPQNLQATFASSDPNYNGSSITVPLTVLKINLYVKADDKSRQYGTANPTFTAKYFGAKIKIVVLGSSTAFGTGASATGTKWTSLLNSKLTNDYGTLAVSITNLADGINNINTYSILPTGTNNGTRPAVDPNRNITKALSSNPQIILINMPSNDVKNGYTSAETMANFATVINIARAAGVKVILTGTQPRGDIGDPATRQLLQTENQTLLSIYGSDCVNIYDELTDFSTYSIKSMYDFGDHVHVNDLGHNYIYTQILQPVKAWIEANTSGFVNGDGPGSLSGTATFSTNPVTDLLSPVGTYAINAGGSLSSPNYAIFYRSGVLTVTPGSPAVTWSNPPAITYGTPLTSQQLNATSGVPGSFAYTPAAGSVLNAGTQTLSVTFTPTDLVNYQPSAKTVSLTVNKAPLYVVANNKTKTSGQENPPFTASYLGGGTLKIVVLGSSTAAGTGATSTPNSWVGLLTAKLAVDYPYVTTSVSNLAVGGFTTYQILPTGTPNTPGRPGVDAAHNITAALAQNPKIILINMPSNDVAGNFTSTETMANFATVINLARNAGVKVILTGTQPRGDISVANSQILQTQNQTMLSTYPSDAVDVYTELVDLSGTSQTNTNYYGIKPIYSIVTDQIHVNNAGHNYIYSQMLPVVKAWVEANNNGFVNGDTQGSLSGALNLTTTATAASPAGNYVISTTGSTLSSPNYQITYVDGVLSVTDVSGQSITLKRATLVGEASTDEKALSLEAWPNPMSDQAMIRFKVKSDGSPVRIALFNTNGVLLKEVYKGNVEAGGQRNVTFRAGTLPSGIYLIRITAGAESTSKKIVVTH